MSEGAVALREQSPQLLNEELERKKSEARTLELQVTRKEAELRRAKEEQELLNELRTVNDMILSKKKAGSGSEGRVASGIKISPESLAELRALEDELKIETKKTEDLQTTSNVISHQLEEVERGLEKQSTQLAIVKRSTAWEKDTRAYKVSSALASEFYEKRRTLEALHEEQRTVKEHTDRLTKEIEELSHHLDKQATVDERIAEAEEQLRKQEEEYQDMFEKVKSFERLRKKKERLLDQPRDDDKYKVVRRIEGDKKVLHNNLTSLRETNVSNSKSIVSLEVRLRQLETRLEAVNLFLKQVFAEVEDDEPIEGVPEGATEVPLTQFEELIRELEVSRDTVLQRDNQLNSHDAKVEQLEQKIDILQNAIRLVRCLPSFKLVRKTGNSRHYCHTWTE
ncbi:hypothetical protein STCU_09733 [Strigomonas culicis]|uniref:Uncharacterized protein n=1 Tax=Strigomonas culicis TaxID=28005 RepID=S9TQE1_9TRYP|nr:hypothetical protein STCU_09733 [Strigomonas culicis]|eukprot:EPY18869.1 hypothetical protein STCU_09733 [Strigomonas culicis]